MVNSKKLGNSKDRKPLGGSLENFRQKTLKSVIPALIAAKVIACTDDKSGPIEVTDRPDAISDTGEQFRDVLSGADAQDTGFGDSGVDTFDIGASDVVDSETDTSADTSDTVSTDTLPEVEGTDARTAIPESTLYIRNTEAERIRFAGSESIVKVADYELCAEGADIAIAAITLQMNGEFEADVSIIMPGIIDDVVPSGSFRDINILSDSTGDIVVSDGTCIPFEMYFEDYNEDFTTWVYPNINFVTLETPNSQVVYGSPGRGRVFAHKTIFRGTEGMQAEYGNDGEVTVPRSTPELVVGDLSICTKGNQQGTINGLDFRIIANEGALIPISVRVDYRNDQREYFPDLPYGFSDAYLSGDVVPVRFEEVLDYGSCVSVSFSLPLITSSLDEIQLELVGVDATVPVDMFEFTEGDIYEFGDQPTLFTKYLIVPDPVYNGITIQWNGNYNDNRSKYFTYDIAPEHSFCSLTLDGFCPVSAMSLSTSSSDPREETQLRSLDLRVESSGIPDGTPLKFVVTVYGDTSTVFTYDQVIGSGIYDINLPIDATLGSRVRNVEIQAYVRNTDLYAVSDREVAPWIRFNILDIDASSATAFEGNLIPGDYESEGFYNLDEYDATGPKVNFAYPELYLAELGTGAPRTVNISEITDGIRVELSNVAIESVNGGGCIDEFVFRHNTGKFNAPETPPFLDVNGNTYVLSGWNELTATYTFLDQCLVFDDQSTTTVSVVMLNPDLTTVTEPGSPWNMQLIQLRYSTSIGRALPDSRVINGFDEFGVKMPLSVRNPVDGIRTNVRP